MPNQSHLSTKYTVGDLFTPPLYSSFLCSNQCPLDQVKNHSDRLPVMTERPIHIQGIIFRLTIRAFYASLDLIVTNHNNHEHKYEKGVVEEEAEKHIIAILQCPTDLSSSPSASSSWRTKIRRECKLGTEIEICGTFSSSSPSSLSSSSNYANKRFHVSVFTQHNIHNAHELTLMMKIIQIQKWDLIQCQTMRQKYYPGTNNIAVTSSNDDNAKIKRCSIENATSSNTSMEEKQFSGGHTGGGLGKLKKGEIIADFLIHLVGSILFPNDHNLTNNNQDQNLQEDANHTNSMNKLNDKHNECIQSRFINFSTKNNNIQKYDSDKYTKIIEYLNSGSGVCDIAGGNGHLSLALALKGIHSTVIDPRESVGKLPGRDRKFLRKALKQTQMIQTQPQPIEFSTIRAWFSKRPDGIDTGFREGSTSIEHDNDYVPVCTICSSDGLLSSCSAIIALHPDEATGEIVEFAVKHRKLFIVVPCCVFSRLFPFRYKPSSMTGKNEEKEIVSTYSDLIEYLVDKDENIQVTKLDFDGANLAVWSTFQ